MSKKLDDELAQALGDATSEAAPTSTPPVAGPKNAAQPPANRSLGLLVALLVMVGALVALFLVGFKEAAIYALPVQDLLSSKEDMVGRKVRIEAELVPGTLVKRDSPCEYRFSVHGGGKEVPVRYAQCVVPDTFRDVPGGGVQVTVEGALNPEGSFDATLVMAKCTSKYDPSTHEMKGAAEMNPNTPIN